MVGISVFTNNVLEGFFRTLKHGERRRSGRAVLTQDLEQLPPAAALALNLTHPDYVEIPCGSLDKLPTAFARLNASGQWPAKSASDFETTSRSLPAADRDIVRTDEMSRRVDAAANSRAPRRRRGDREYAALVEHAPRQPSFDAVGCPTSAGTRMQQLVSDFSRAVPLTRTALTIQTNKRNQTLGSRANKFA